jgi:phosphoglycerol transferase MdoB-like AlkP superfamily enzyme
MNQNIVYSMILIFSSIVLFLTLIFKNKISKKVDTVIKCSFAIIVLVISILILIQTL